jgi:hypothetical protein
MEPNDSLEGLDLVARLRKIDLAMLECMAHIAELVRLREAERLTRQN